MSPENFFAVLLGNKTAVKGGSGKVVASKPKDRIFVFYSDHGGPGVLGIGLPSFIYSTKIKMFKFVTNLISLSIYCNRYATLGHLR